MTTANPRQGSRKGGLRLAAMAFGVLVTIALGSTAFVRWNFSGPGPLIEKRFSADAFFAALGEHVGWLIAFAVLSAAMLPLRAFQWQFTLDKRVPFMERWHFVNIGATVHNLIPGNLGDVTRAFLLARTQKLPFIVGLGSVGVCKLLELATLILMAAVALLFPFWDQMPELVSVLRTGAWICVGLVAALLLVAHFSGPLADRLTRKGRWPRVQRWLRDVRAGFATARSLRGMLAALGASFPPNMAAALGYGIGLEAIGVEHGLLAGPMVLALIALGKGTPGLPTGPGMYFLVASWAARALGASAADAAAYALLTNVATGVTQWVPGLVSLAIRRIRWSDLKRQTYEAAVQAKALKRGERPPPHADARPAPPRRVAADSPGRG